VELNHLANRPRQTRQARRESPSEDEPQTQKRRKPLGFPGGFHGFLYGFAALAHTNLRGGERAGALGDREIHAAKRTRMPGYSFERPWRYGF